MNPMSAVGDLAVLDHDLAADELAWVNAVHQDFAQRLQAASGAAGGFTAKEILRQVLGEDRHRLATSMDLSGPGPWRGKNRHGRVVAAVFLPRVELHRHAKSRTDQFAMYVMGEADAFSLDPNGEPILTPVTGGAHFHNPPNAPHAFLPKVGSVVPAEWEIAFIAITPRNLREDTQPVPDDVRAAYKRIVGMEAPHDV
jgi:hypothetical protein